MMSPYRLTARASVIMKACGGIPDRTTLDHPTPEVEVAWLAYHVGWHLMFARQAMGFFSARGTKSVDGMRWAYVAYRRDRERAGGMCNWPARSWPGRRLLMPRCNSARLWSGGRHEKDHQRAGQR